MSTGDALLHGAASIAIEDGIHPFVKLGDRQRRRLMQVLVLAVGAFAYFLAIVQERSLVWLLLSAYGLIDQLAPPVYAALYWRRATTRGILAGLVAGSATTIFFFLNPTLRPFEIHEGILGLMVNVPILVVVSLMSRPQEPEQSGAFVDARAPGT
jgi:SSS family solute:Na+ symporter